ncbi:hypothetical protein JCM24511_05068 [Saitozyma sp. JCM 24511]|nr:hypothetical protein JCM24511_05068 [Saitozyma sp. JCM 24511]
MSNTTTNTTSTFCSTAPHTGCYVNTSPGALAACWAASGVPSYVLNCAEGNSLLCAGSNTTAIGRAFNNSGLANRCVTVTSGAGRMKRKSKLVLVGTALCSIAIALAGPVGQVA